MFESLRECWICVGRLGSLRLVFIPLTSGECIPDIYPPSNIKTPCARYAEKFIVKFSFKQLWARNKHRSRRMEDHPSILQ